jgi:hypothetical protein
MPATKKTAKKVRRSSEAKTPAPEPKANKDVAELNVERMKLTQLKPHPKNPRKHPTKGSPEWEVLRKSLEHDYFDPLVWNRRNGMLVSGHLRRKVFTEMGVKQADVVVVDYDEPTHLARMIAANKSIGSDDLVRLGEIMGELGTITEFDLSLSGFTLDEIKELTEGDTATEGSEKGEIQRGPEFMSALLKNIAAPTHEMKRGDVWKLKGRHHLVCCDPVVEHFKYTPLLEGKNTSKKPNRPGKLLFIAPDPLLFTDYYQDGETIIAVQPDETLASYMLSVFIEAFGEKAAQKLS